MSVRVSEWELAEAWPWVWVSGKGSAAAWPWVRASGTESAAAWPWVRASGTEWAEVWRLVRASEREWAEESESVSYLGQLQFRTGLRLWEVRLWAELRTCLQAPSGSLRLRREYRHKRTPPAEPTLQSQISRNDRICGFQCQCFARISSLELVPEWNFTPAHQQVSSTIHGRPNSWESALFLTSLPAVTQIRSLPHNGCYPKPGGITWSQTSAQ